MRQFPFIDLFKSALHVSGDIFAYLQEQFVYTTSVQYTDLLPTGDTAEMELLKSST
jgi:hypothetical protein